MQAITEEDKIHESWYEEAKGMTIEELPNFIDRLLNEYKHDYGIICHAMAACAIATLCAMNKQEGITSFQAGAVMWQFIRHWMSIEGPMKLLQYRNLLYPQYENDFNTIDKETLTWLREQAAKKLADEPDAPVKDYWQQIVNGYIPAGLTMEVK